MRLLLVASALVLALALVTGAQAKEGVEARILTPIDREAGPGSRVTVTWTLSFVENGQRRAFGGGDVFVRLFGPGDARSRRVPGAPIRVDRRAATYRATVRVPRGGVRRVVIGLMGISCVPSSSRQKVCRPSPHLFPIVGRVFR